MAEADRILRVLGIARIEADRTSEAIDRIVLHPLVGPLVLAVVMFLVFQAVFAWSQPPMEWIQRGVEALGATLAGVMPASALKSLLIDGVLAGVGSVLVFLPQILILFFFILLLEDSGYLPRAAFLLDRLMGSVGLSGRSFIPLLSSFACAVPGIMATRTIPDARDRWITIMIAPLMTCSARLPVYALLIGAFIPARLVGPGIQLQGLVLFALYVAGIVSAFLVAFVLTRTTRGQAAPLLMELPAYHWPNARHLALGLLERAKVFLRRVGTTILALMVILWALSSFPAPPPGATGSAIEYSIAGQLGALLALVLEPVGFNWQISIALVSGPRGARGGRRRARHRLLHGGRRRAGKRGAAARDRGAVEPGHRPRPARLVRVRAAVPVDAGGREARDRRLANADPHGVVPVRAGLPCRVRHVPRGARARRLTWSGCSTCWLSPR